MREKKIVHKYEANGNLYFVAICEQRKRSAIIETNKDLFEKLEPGDCLP